MYSFDGQHKSGPNISLGGSSKKVSKSSLLQSARQERMKRESIRKQINAATSLQAWFRGCLTRGQLAKHKRIEYDKVLQQVQKNETTSFDQLKHLAQQINIFYNFNEDYKRLVTLCQFLLKLASTMKLSNLFAVSLSDWIHRIKNLLVLCCRSLHQTSETNITIPLRMLEVFTEAQTYSWLEEQTAISLASSITVCIIQKGYFRDLRDLIKLRIPSSIEPSEHPPTPFAAAARDLVIKPISLLTKGSTEDIRIAQSALITDLLSPSMSEPICFFLVPAISKSIPITSFLESILVSESCCTVWSLYSFLMICKNKLSTASTDQLMLFMNCLKKIINRLQSKKEYVTTGSLSKYDSESDDSDMDIDQSENVKQLSVDSCLRYVQEKCLEILNEKETTNAVLYLIDQTHHNNNCIEAVCQVVHHLITSLHLQVHKARLLYSLAFNGKLLNSCWRTIQILEMKTSSGKKVKLIERLTYGYTLLQEDESRIVAILSCFTILFRYALFSIYDADFYSEGTEGRVSMMPFTLAELVEMSHLLRELVIGLITLIYPDIKSIHDGGKWTSLCLNVTQLLKQLYGRDARHQFCPENHWLSERASFNQENVNIITFLEEEDEDDVITSTNNSTRDSRCLAILKYIPFAVPFLQRVRIFHKILSEDLKRSRNIEQTILPSHGMNISVNRKYLYQDAYDQLSQDRAADIRQVIRVQMINAHGLDEAGIDGGGVFREFMTQLLKTGFDPSYGFFKLTSQQQLYPNPDIGQIQPDYLKHLHFLGRMLGKIIYESMMVELPLADFFLCKLLNKHGADVDIYHLESLDPELYKNLLSLKNYDGDVDDLTLNFTVVRSDYGETRVEELKPGGKDICVTNSNRIEYIHLMADYRLNKQIRAHCNAFRAGLSDVINIEWLQMFDHRELQILISGAQVPVDIDDMRINTNYSGAYTTDDEYIEAFWQIVRNLTDKQKRQFLKFVTSCSRPPLLGFSELYPQFCIHYGGDEERLPTASTCMNLLKLPKYQNKELLKAKLIYAIEAEAGFELS